MSKTETLRQSAAASNELRMERLAEQIEDLRQAKAQSVEELAAKLEPLALAMAELVDETRKTLAEIERKSQEHGEKFAARLTTTTQAWTDAAEAAQGAVSSLDRAGRRMEWQHYAMVAMACLLSTVLTTVFWVFLVPPPRPSLELDAKALAEHVKPALIEALKPSKGR